MENLNKSGDIAGNIENMQGNSDCDSRCNTFEFVYRIDTRKPEEIFENGFEPRHKIRPQSNLLEHVEGSDIGCFISTTYKKHPDLEIYNPDVDTEQVKPFSDLIKSLRRETSVYVYKIRAGPNFYNAMASFEAIKGTEIYKKNEYALEQCIQRHRDEDELTVTEKIPPTSIHSVSQWVLEDDAYVPITYIKNELYDMGLTTTSNPNPFVYKIA